MFEICSDERQSFLPRAPLCGEEALHGVLARDFQDYFLKLLPKNKMMDLLKTDTEMPDSDVNIEYLVDNIWIVGSPDEVAGKLRRLYEDVGGFGVLLAMGHEWHPRDKWERSMTLLAQEVMPRLAETRHSVPCHGTGSSRRAIRRCAISASRPAWAISTT